MFWCFPFNELLTLDALNFTIQKTRLLSGFLCRFSLKPIVIVIFYSTHNFLHPKYLLTLSILSNVFFATSFFSLGSSMMIMMSRESCVWIASIALNLPIKFDKKYWMRSV